MEKISWEQIARRVMQEHGFLPDFSTAALAQLAKIQQVNGGTEPAMKDLRQLLWASIDNDDNRLLSWVSYFQPVLTHKIKPAQLFNSYMRQEISNPWTSSIYGLSRSVLHISLIC